MLVRLGSGPERYAGHAGVEDRGSLEPFVMGSVHGAFVVAGRARGVGRTALGRPPIPIRLDGHAELRPRVSGHFPRELFEVRFRHRFDVVSGDAVVVRPVVADDTAILAGDDHHLASGGLSPGRPVVGRLGVVDAILVGLCRQLDRHRAVEKRNRKSRHDLVLSNIGKHGKWKQLCL